MMGKAAWVPEEFPGDVRVLTGSGSARSQDASPKVTLSRRLRPFRAMPTQRASGAHCRDLTRAQRAPVHAPNTVVFAGTIAKQRSDMNSIIDCHVTTFNFLTISEALSVGQEGFKTG